MADVEVIVPWRGGCPHRERALGWVVARYREAGYPVTIGDLPDGPWIKAKAVQAAMDATTAQVLVVADADAWCDAIHDTVRAVADGRARWGAPHRVVRRLKPDWTERVLDGLDPADIRGAALEEPSYRAHLGGGIVIIERTAYDEVPLDPRHVDWGHEDDDWALALDQLVGPPHRDRGVLWHLWHPPQVRRSRIHGSDASLALHHRYLEAARQHCMADLVAEYRTEVTA